MDVAPSMTEKENKFKPSENFSIVKGSWIKNELVHYVFLPEV